MQEVNMVDFQYALPPERIALYPHNPRDESKLLVYNKGNINHEIFKSLPYFLPKNAHLVFNNTKVVPARVFFQKSTGAHIEVFILKPSQEYISINTAMDAHNFVNWECMIGNKKKWKSDEVLTLSINDIKVEALWIDYENNIIKFAWNTDFTFAEILNLIGTIPLPPYIQRKAESSDVNNYQTVFSEIKGAVAAPTAGLHFTDNVLNELENHNISKSFLTLHVGAGTFLPVKVENALDHPMHNEQIVLTKSFIDNLLFNHDFVIPVGTTAMRSLESLYWFGYALESNPNAQFNVFKLYAYENTIELSVDKCLKNVLTYMTFNNLEILIGQTEILIMPSYKFKLAKGLITNFHQPGSTLILLVAALVGQTHWQAIYQSALNNNYRFLSYGDSSLLIP